jgi:hypothetical protein
LICHDPAQAHIILVDSTTDAGTQFIRDWGTDPAKFVLEYPWARKSIEAGRALLQNDNWGDCVARDDGRSISGANDDEGPTAKSVLFVIHSSSSTNLIFEEAHYLPLDQLLRMLSSLRQNMVVVNMFARNPIQRAERQIETRIKLSLLLAGLHRKCNRFHNFSKHLSKCPSPNNFLIPRLNLSNLPIPNRPHNLSNSSPKSLHSSILHLSHRSQTLSQAMPESNFQTPFP